MNCYRGIYVAGVNGGRNKTGLFFGTIATALLLVRDRFFARDVP